MNWLAVLASGQLLACSLPDPGARVDPVGPSRADFAFVAPVLSRRCGTLDCHGSPYRNLRVYGYGGQRLGGSGTLTPDAPNWLTPEEVDATYDSVVSLEPEIMREVVEAGGANPERLTFLRKGRGTEDHKGKQRIVAGDPSDACITSWLAGSVNRASCDEGACIVGATDAGAATIGQCP